MILCRLTRPLEALAARVEVANHRLENLPAIIHHIVKQTTTDTSTDQMQTIMKAIGEPDGKSIAGDVGNLNDTVVTCLDTVSAGLRELPTRQEVDRRLGAVYGFLNQQRDIFEDEVEVGVTRTVQSVAEKVDAATSDVKGQVINSAHDIKEAMAGMADMISGVKHDVASVKDEVTGMKAAMTGMGDLALGVESEVIPVGEVTRWAVDLAHLISDANRTLSKIREGHTSRRDVGSAMGGSDSRVKDASTTVGSQVEKRVESMQQIFDGYLAHLATMPGNYEKGFSTLTANYLELSKAFGAMKNEAEQLGKLVPGIVDMQEKAKTQAHRIYVLEEDVNTLNNTIISKKWWENRQSWLIDQMRQKEQAQVKLIAGMQQKVDSQAAFIVNLRQAAQRVVDDHTLAGHVAGEF